jgi:hypothetical protein
MEALSCALSAFIGISGIYGVVRGIRKSHLSGFKFYVTDGILKTIPRLVILLLFFILPNSLHVILVFAYALTLIGSTIWTARRELHAARMNESQWREWQNLIEYSTFFDRLLLYPGADDRLREKKKTTQDRQALSRSSEFRSNFTLPDGVNFYCSDFISASALSGDLVKIVGFLQHVDQKIHLRRFDDWWQYNGLHFSKGSIDFRTLLEIVRSPESILEAMTGDEAVRVGVAPPDESWYLRFYSHQGNDTAFVEGDYEITLPPDLANAFSAQVLPRLTARIQQAEAKERYRKWKNSR